MSASLVLDLIDDLRPKFWDRAACRGAGVDRWFPTQGANYRPAKRICADCPVKQECLDYALDHEIRHGVWGGTTEAKRRRLRRTIPRRAS